MHECVNCGEQCDCDMEDLEHDEAPEDCIHECESLNELDDFDEIYAEEDAEDE